MSQSFIVCGVSDQISDLLHLFDENRCSCCKEAAAMNLCSACKSARYCSKTCQKKDWTDHKTICTDLRKVRKQQESLTGLVEVGMRQKANGKTVMRKAHMLSSLICPNVVLMHCGHGYPKWWIYRAVQEGESFCALGYHHQFESVHHTVHPYYICPLGCKSHDPDPECPSDWFADVDIVSSAIKELFTSTNVSIKLPANWYLTVNNCTCSRGVTGVILCERNVPQTIHDTTMEEHKSGKSKLKEVSNRFTRLEKRYGKTPVIRSSSIRSSTPTSATSKQ